MSEPVLELRNATVVKGGVTILHALNLTIHDGEHTAILGPNGSGKSTLVKLLTHHDHAWAVDDEIPPPVLIARALVTNPRALVLDEPTSGLDIISRHRFLEQVEKIGEAGTTLIFVTHHVEEIVPAVERVVLLKDGHVAFDGPKREML